MEMDRFLALRDSLYGFADNAHFTHAFKRLFGITPSEYIVSEHHS